MDITRSQNRHRAFTLVELLTVIAVLAVLGALLLPALAQQSDPQAMAQRAQCQNNLKMVGLAFRTWEGDYSDKYPANVPKSKGGVKEDAAEAFRSFQVMSNELNNPKIITCPADAERQPAAGFSQLSNKNVSYFVGVDADETFPAMILSGDRNLTVNGTAVKTGLVTVKKGDTVSWTEQMHQNFGNVGLADGSVQQTTGNTAQQFFVHSGTNVNRLAIP